jgi:acyl carrier protein
MFFSLRSLMIAAMTGPLVLGSEIVSLLDWRHWLLIAIVAIATLWTWISFWPERRFRKELAKRERIDDATFVREFYSATDVPEDIPRRLKPIFCDFFQIELGKLRPDDRPPEIVELDTIQLILDIEKEFGVSIPDKDAEQINGSFDSLVRYLASRRALPALGDSSTPAPKQPKP